MIHLNKLEYEYRGLMATSWDLFRVDTSDWSDRSFYRKIILDNGQPALDVGSGTGRLLLDYLSEGLDVDGIDISPEMNKICMEKAQVLGVSPSIYQQTLESLDLPRKYRTILIPSSTFQLVTDPLAAQTALERCYRHLEDGGKLVMSIMDISQDTNGDWILIQEQKRSQDNLLVRRWLKSTYDPVTELEHTEDRYELLSDGEIVETENHSRSPATRNYSLNQILEMLEIAGFKELSAVKGFSDEPALPDDDMFCVLGTKK